MRQPGAFSETFILPERNLHAIPDWLPSEVAVFTEPVAAACEILEQVAIPPGSMVAVLGDGKLGLLISQTLKSFGCRVHQFGRHAEKLAIAENAGVTTELVGGRVPEAEYQWVVDATGSPAGLRDAVRMVQPRGTVILSRPCMAKCRWIPRRLS